MPTSRTARSPSSPPPPGSTEALDAGAIAGILTLEGAEPLGREPELARLFGRLGVRSIGLTWNRANDFADGTTEDRGAGITPAGRRLLAEMAEAGIALDLSHLTERGRTMRSSTRPGPVFASHSNAAAVYATLRNVSDDVLRGIAERGGVCGLNLLPVLIGPAPVGEQAAAHRDHIAAVAGETVPAIGGDFVAFLPPGPSEPHHLRPPEGFDATLAAAPEPPRETAYGRRPRRRRGRSGDAAADALLAGNALAFLRRALPGLTRQAMPATGAGAGSGLCGRPGRASPRLYSRGATSFADAA